MLVARAVVISVGCVLQIRNETGSRVDLPTEKSDSEYIVITGKRESAEKARDMILAMERQLVRVRGVGGAGKRGGPGEWGVWGQGLPALE